MHFCMNEQNMSRLRKNLSILSLIVLCYPLSAQDTIPEISDKEVVEGWAAKVQPASSYAFLKLEENYVRNVVALSDFYEKLYKLRKGENYRVQIVQMGDSHIQADYLTRAVRRNFQIEFGNAGRGLIIPGRLART